MNRKVSSILNLLIVIFVLLGTILMFSGFKFMPSEALLETTSVGMFKYYTVDSNILMGICALVFLIAERKQEKVNDNIYVFKLVGTSAITLTFLTTLFFLAPSYGFYRMYNNSNLLFHLIVPLLAIISFVFFEKNSNIKYKYSLFGIIPMAVYSIFYTSNIIIHMSEGLTYKYDFYGFLQGNINNMYIVIPVIYFTSFLISGLLILSNKKFGKEI